MGSKKVHRIDIVSSRNYKADFLGTASDNFCAGILWRILSIRFLNLRSLRNFFEGHLQPGFDGLGWKCSGNQQGHHNTQAMPLSFEGASMSCGKTDNWASVEVLLSDYKGFFTGTMLAVGYMASVVHI
jgi:hypothetical protein